MFIYNSLPAPAPSIVCQPPCQAKHAGPLQTDPEHDFGKKRSLSSIFPPLLLPKLSHPFLPPCFPKSDTLGENCVDTEGRAKEGEGGRDGWIEKKREGAEVYFMQHGLLNWFQSSSWTPGIRGTHCRLAVFAFAGCRKFDHYPCRQPTSHLSLPSTMKGAMRTKPLNWVTTTITNNKLRQNEKCVFHSNVEWLHHITLSIFPSGRKTHDVSPWCSQGWRLAK